MKIIAELKLTELPERCDECPIHNGEDGSCKIDGRVSEWRPFWCPLKIMNTEEAENCIDEGYYGWCT